MLPWAIGGIFVIFLIIAYIVIQGTRSAMAWRSAAAAGDVGVIRDIVEDAIKAWSSQKRPKEVRVEVWRGIQGMQAAEIAPGFIRVSVNAESEYHQDSGRWIEVSNPLQEGTEITSRAIDMLYYELPHYRPEFVQVDVYTQYRDEDGETHHNCVLSTSASREQARGIDWDDWSATEIVQEFGGVYRLSETGRPLPIEPLSTPEQYLVAETEPAAAEVIG
jgi:hypothetical protein